MAKYKVGDKVKIRSDLIVGEEYGEMKWLIGMKDLSGCVLTVMDEYANLHHFEETPYTLSEDMIECIVEESENEPAPDPVNSPSHYTQGGMECIDEMIALYGVEEVKSFCKLNVHKYRKRALYKNGEEDMKKSNWYMNKYVELKNYDKKSD